MSKRLFSALLGLIILSVLTRAVADDLNTSGALGGLFTFVKAINVAIESGLIGPGDQDRVAATLDRMDKVLGVLDADVWQVSDGGAEGSPDAEIDSLVAERQAAREARDFERADQVRDQLTELGIVVEDTASGPRWKRQ